MSRFGIDLESNGLAAWLYHTTGLDGVLLAKGAVLLTTIGLLVATATRFPRLLVWGGAAATSIGLLGFATNTASILILGYRHRRLRRCGEHPASWSAPWTSPPS